MSGSFTPPTLAGFTAWIYSDMGISTTSLPTTSPAIGYAYNVALAIVGQLWSCINPLIYTLMVYNLGGDNLINFAPDSLLGTPPDKFFSTYRAANNITDFCAGVVNSAGDQGTSGSLTVGKGLQNLTLSNLQNLKTPWGRTYLAFAQRSGMNPWGVS